MAQPQGFADKVAFVWKVADKLRGNFKAHEYGQVVLPLLVMRRLDAVLADTKPAVLTKAAALEASGMNPAGADQVLQNTAGFPFYNTSPLDFAGLLADDKNTATTLRAYVNAFSPGAVEVLEAYDFDAKITRLDKAGILYQVLADFADLDLHPDHVSNEAMGYIFEELLRKFSEMSNETAGEHYTPREIIRLMVDLLFCADTDALTGPAPVRTVYDPAAGTGGMLSVSETYIEELNSAAQVQVFGQELNPETWAIARSELMIKGADPSHMVLGNSLTEDGFTGQRFDYMLANPPYGVDWKAYRHPIETEHKTQGFSGRFGPGLPRVSDGSFLFLLHMLSKMKPVADDPNTTWVDGGSRIAIVLSGSPLFSGGAGSGESEIRRWILENDLLEGIVALPDQMFYNTGIYTYIWILTNRKDDDAAGTVRLVDARELGTKMRKSLGDKRKELTGDAIATITQLYADADTRQTGPGVNRLVQHSAGSGKSNTISWAAHSLSRLHTPGDAAQVTAAGLGANEPIFHKVIVVTDRRALDTHLQATVGSFEHTPGVLVRIDDKMTSQDLKAALESNAARIIITTLQKFPVVAAYAAEQGGTVAGKRFAVIVDEAHSSTSGEAMKDLKGVLSGTKNADSDQDMLDAVAAAEAAVVDKVKDATDLIAESMTARGQHDNMSFYAFTATPKPKTLELFGTLATQPDGSERRVPFHLYSMKQAIDEGFILDVLANYTSYATYYKLATSSPEDPEVPTSKASAALARFVSLHPTNLGQKAQIIVEHFRTKTAGKIGGRAKAMIVTRSRLHAVRYKQAIDAYIEANGLDTGDKPIRALVAFSGSVVDPAAPTVSYTEAMMNGFGEAQLPKKFDSDEYQVLVVAEKYQTGFDQPLLHTMYVDKQLSGVKAVQTLSRLNRIHPGKTDTFILDFVNDPEDIQESFRPFYEESTATPTDPNLLYTLRTALLDAHVLHPEEMTAAVTALLSGQSAKQKTVYANLTPAKERFKALPSSDDRDQFLRTLTAYIHAYAFLAQVMPWTDSDLETLFLYGKALATVLPKPPGGPIPPLDDSVVLTHLRNTALAEGVDISLDRGTDEPGVALPGGGTGRSADIPTERLSVLISTLNERYGMDLTDADKVWFDQQKQALKQDEQVRVIALNNDRDNFRHVLETHATSAIVERHEANSTLFDAFFEKPGFKEALLDYLAEAYDEIRDESAG